MSYLSRAPLDVGALIAQVTSPERGGIATFLGMVRNHHAGRTVDRLEYSSYEPMAEAESARIVAEAQKRWPVAVRVQHRLGELAVGEIAVAVVAAGSHRDEAFAACRFVIEEVKRRVPVWKKEYYADGTVAWVDPSAPGSAVEAEAAL